MRRAALILVVLFGRMASANAQGISFARAGIGFNAAFVVIDVEPIDLAFNAAACGDVAFSLGSYGEIHYKPNVGVLFGGHHRAVRYYHDHFWYDDEIDWFALEVHLDIADLAYYFPLPINVPVRPYVGLGPMVAIQHTSYFHPDPDILDTDDTDARVGFNFFGGADFRLSQAFALYVERRGRVSRWDLFKLIGGARWSFGQY